MWLVGNTEVIGPATPQATSCLRSRSHAPQATCHVPSFFPELNELNEPNEPTRHKLQATGFLCPTSYRPQAVFRPSPANVV
jgi:hypothetical protein